MVALLHKSHNRGFTLVELIAVMMLMSVTLLGVTSFLSWGTLAFVDGADRQRMAEETRFVIERLTRDLRSALPNSIRIAGDGLCVEFIPILGSGSYYNLDAGDSPDVVNIIADERYAAIYVANDDFVIQPQSTAQLYAVGNGVRENTSAYTVAGGSDDIKTATVTLSGAVTYSATYDFNVNKANRYYMVRNQVSYCVNLSTDTLTRYEYANLYVNQPSESTLANGEVMAERIVNTNALTDQVFSFADNDFTTVQMLFLFARSNGTEPMHFYHQVRVKNDS